MRTNAWNHHPIITSSRHQSSFSYGNLAMKSTCEMHMNPYQKGGGSNFSPDGLLKVFKKGGDASDASCYFHSTKIDFLHYY